MLVCTQEFDDDVVIGTTAENRAEGHTKGSDVGSQLEEEESIEIYTKGSDVGSQLEEEESIEISVTLPASSPVVPQSIASNKRVEEHGILENLSHNIMQLFRPASSAASRHVSQGAQQLRGSIQDSGCV